MWRDLLGMYLSYCSGAGRPVGLSFWLICELWHQAWNTETEADSE